MEISTEPLDLRLYAHLVADDGAGAVATFMGVTRDNFNGKEVLKLSYEAYEPMAEKEMEVGSSRFFPTFASLFQCTYYEAIAAQVICNKARDKWSIKRIAIAHRTGEVDIGEPSVIIAVSSAHRKEALEVSCWHFL